MVQQKLVFSEKTNKDDGIHQEERKSFSIDSLNKDIIEIPLIECCEFIKDGTHGSFKDSDKGIPLLSAKDIRNGKIELDNSPRLINIDDYNKIHKNYEIENGDILLTIVGSIGRVALVHDEPKFSLQRSVAILRPKNNLNHYLFYLIQSDYFQNELFRLINFSAQGGVYLNSLKNIKIKLNKNKNEQEIIISALKNIDKKIELLEKKLNIYQKYYEYVSNNYFDNITCDNIVKFKDIISKGKAGGTPKSSNKSYYGGEIPFLSINDMTTQGKYISYTTKMITEEGLNNSNAWIIPKNSLLYSIYASIGFVSINKIELTTSQAIYGVILNENINQDFIYHYLKNFKRHIYKYIETGTQGNLNSKIVKDIPIKLPSNAEQKTYADFFNKFDEIIEIKLNEIDKLKEFKKGLLQKMFV